MVLGLAGVVVVVGGARPGVQWVYRMLARRNAETPQPSSGAALLLRTVLWHSVLH